MMLFGKKLFEHEVKEEYLYDFAQWGVIRDESFNNDMLFQFVAPNVIGQKPTKKKKKVVETIQLTPKAVFEMKMLNDDSFKIGSDPEYLEKALEHCKDKLALFPKHSPVLNNRPLEAGVISFGRQEVNSMIERLNNRRQIEKWKEVVEKYPHTTNSIIHELMKKHTNLRFELASKMVTDMPGDAVKAMKEYDAMCKKLCGKRAVFYVIAEQKDFERVAKRRDPILLAQSPFGFFWQVLGAWDKEIMYLGEL
ncbi:MAG: hypothetical protein C5B59_12730 [Bacteroidetes bacterium]|nr:MAG: hypothetical protein C5B59_12730 [Bacteroidota bacterium]